MEHKTLELLDPVTRFPHYLSLLPTLEKQVRQDQALGMLFISLTGLDRVEEAHGPKVVDDLIREVSKALRELHGTMIRQTDLICVPEIGHSSFMVFLSETRKDREINRLQEHDVELVADRVQENLFPRLFELLYQYTKSQPKLAVGYAFTVHNPLIRARRLIYRLIDEAKDMAKLQAPRVEMRTKERLQRIILQEQIKTVFQPILNIKTGKLMGYEALTRGPKGTIFESPLMLFALARDAGLVFELDRICRRKALTAAKKLPSNCKIFINTLPNTIHDPEFRGKYLNDFLADIEKKPENIVFEITERAAIENFAMFREAIRYYTDIGMSIAVDDTGTGYSTLEAIVELHPRYLKFDLSMVSGIGKSPLKQEMLKLLLNLATRIGAEIIAEGIENKEDLIMLQKMGLDWGQGFYFSKPMPIEEILAQATEVTPKKRKSAKS